MEGFIVSDLVSEFPAAKRRMAQWLKDGRLRHREDVQEGQENAPATLKRLFHGEDVGKQLLRV